MERNLFVCGPVCPSLLSPTAHLCRSPCRGLLPDHAAAGRRHPPRTSPAPAKLKLQAAKLELKAAAGSPWPCAGRARAPGGAVGLAGRGSRGRASRARRRMGSRGPTERETPGGGAGGPQPWPPRVGGEAWPDQPWLPPRHGPAHEEEEGGRTCAGGGRGRPYLAAAWIRLAACRRGLRTGSSAASRAGGRELQGHGSAGGGAAGEL